MWNGHAWSRSGRLADRCPRFGESVAVVDGRSSTARAGLGDRISSVRPRTGFCATTGRFRPGGRPGGRDGVDVPGRSLRLIVFDRVPWPRPDILHRARRNAFGGRRYDDMLTRLRLKQAFGRLVRRADDCGVFVLLDPMMPSRLAGAFPDAVELQRVGLAEAVGIVGDFLGERGQ